MHYFKKNIGDYAKKTGRLSMLQHGAYTLLIDSCYDREQFPTLEQAIEWTWASSKEEIEAVEFILKRFFTLNDGVYVQSRIQEEINEYHGKSEINKRIALEREAKRKEKGKKRERSVHEASPVVHEAPPNQEPLTKNHKPLTNLKAEGDSSESPAPTKRAKRLTLQSLPEDWFNFCRGERPDLNPKEVFDRFRDYWIAQGGQKGCKLDWLATWRNWVRSEKQIPKSSFDRKMKTLSGLTGGILGNSADAQFKPITEAQTIDMEQPNANLLG